MLNLKSKIFLTLLLIGAFIINASAQNKSLGVGTATPNSNAALHVESPTTNQGFIMPRLTTAQRTAMNGILSGVDNGLMLYDTDLKAIYIWNGSAWASASKLIMPYRDSITTSPPNNSNLFKIEYNGSVTENVGVAQFSNYNPNNGFTTMFVTNAGTNGAGYFQVLNTNSLSPALRGITNSNQPNVHGFLGRSTGIGGSGGAFDVTNVNTTQPAILGTSVGKGSAGSFTVNNSASTSYAVYAQSNGDTLSAAVHGNNIGNGFGVYGKSAGSMFGSAGVYGLHVGTGDAAGAFRISNASNPYAGLYGETNGTGSAIRSLNLGTGNGAYFRKDGSNPGSSAVWADNFGNDGYGGIIQNTSVSNSKPSLYAESVGSGASVWALKSTDAVSGDALLAENWITTGRAAKFVTTSPANTDPTIEAVTNSSSGGSAINANQTGVGDAIYATASSGSAGNFQISTGTGSYSALFAMTNAQDGHAIGAVNSADGSAFSIFTGGMKISTYEVTVGTSIDTRAVAYRVSGGGPSFTLGFPSNTGDMYMVYNDTAGAITVAGVSIPSGQGKIIINFNGGSFRGL